MNNLWVYILSAALLLSFVPVAGTIDVVLEYCFGNQFTFSRFSFDTAKIYPIFRQVVCYFLGTYAGHVFTLRLTPRPLPDWLSLSLFVALPYIVAIVIVIFRLETLTKAVTLSRITSEPLIPILVWMGIGVVVGSKLLHQTE